MANETQLKEVEYACGNCGMSEIIKINCGVNTDWYETAKCRNCGETNLIQWEYVEEQELIPYETGDENEEIWLKP